MHATIILNRSIVRVLQYHELKVEKGIAECIRAENFVKQLGDLGYKDKLYNFQRLMNQNEMAEKKTLHIFLNFGFGEKIANDKLSALTQQYMEGMGWDRQPYLLYRHDDTHHLHTHVVSTSIRDKGERIKIPLRDYYRSRELTHQLERQYGLSLSAPEFPLQKVQYGQMPLLQAMSKVLEAVLPVYKFTSLPELNAILRMYNMEATRGHPRSFTWKKGGLLYQPLGKDGKPEGAYIKASVFERRPTLRNLEMQFAANQPLRQHHLSRLTTSIDGIFIHQVPDLMAFRIALQRDRISTIVQKDRSGQPQNIWYVDQVTHCAFDGAALGGRYTMAALQKRCISEHAHKQQEQQRLLQRQQQRGRDLDQSISL